MQGDSHQPVAIGRNALRDLEQATTHGLAQATPQSGKGGLYSRFGKRAIDLAVSLPALVFLLPVLAVTALLVIATSPGSALYWQDRVGRSGKIFRIAKFRTMIIGADQKGLRITTAVDRRVTRFGALLRKWKIDEIPQLWNVLKGDMSLVGPRPELPEYVGTYTPEQRHVLSVRPGITDIASIRYRHEEQLLGQSKDPDEFYRRVVLPHKLKLNLEYIQRMSFLFDMKLIVQTISSLLASEPELNHD